MNKQVRQEKSDDEVRQGRTTKHMRWVLGLSLAGAIVVLVLAFQVI